MSFSSVFYHSRGKARSGHCFSATGFRLGITRLLLACFSLCTAALNAQGLVATFNTAADVPVTTASYTASGEATFTLGFAPTPGTNLTVIKNTGLPFISGQFSNLANGATVTLSHNGANYSFVAWYYGGDGNNDLVLLWPYTGLAAWGRNSIGQLGDGSTTNRAVPVDVNRTGVLLGKTIVQVACGIYHSLALCSDGTLAAWGWNFKGQLGDNSTTNRLVPVAVNTTAGTSALFGKTVVAITAGNSHSLALCSDGTVAAWGNNGDGQLGDNSLIDRHVPVVVNVASGMSALFDKTVVAVAAGNAHSLALCSDGTVAAWGNNGTGQLGDNSVTTRPTPVAVNVASGTSALFGKTVVAIAAGYGHSLALCNDGAVAGWGRNDFGQLADNSTTGRRVPVAVNVTAGTSALSGKTVVAVTAGYYHSLVLCSDSTVAAWGWNSSGQLGDNTTTDRRVPVTVNATAGTSALSGKTVVAVAAGYVHCLALCSDGAAVAWGANNYGQLGDSSTTQRQVPVAVNLASGTSVLSGRQVGRLSIGEEAYHSIAVYGFAGPPTVTLNTANIFSNSTMLTIIGTGFDATTPGNNTVVFTPSGTGMVTASTETSLTVTNISGLTLGPMNAVVATNGLNSGSAIQVATVSGLAATFNNASDVPVTATSYTASGEVNFTLGFAPPVGTNLTVVKNTGLGFISGQFSNLANGATVNLSYNGTTYPFIAWYYGGEGNNDLVLLWPYTGLAAWGNNSHGQLGDGSTTHHAAPVAVWQRSALLGKTVVQVARGGDRNLALCSDGALVFWGRENSIQFGPASLPKALDLRAGTSALAGKTVIAISAGANHTLALCSDGTVAAWGYNDYGQLGNNSTTSSFVPVAVNNADGTSALSGKTVVAISAGADHNLALCNDGTVVAWGSNYGKLGNNSQTNSTVPVAVNVAGGTSALFGKTVTAISSGANFNLALCSDGTVASWGSNVSGELGDNSLMARPVPVAVNMASGVSALSGKTVVAITAGSSHSLALCSDGTVAAWGDNLYGQLGDNSFINRLIPVAVNMASGTSVLAGRSVTTIAAGATHSLALCSDGLMAAWGNNSRSQLGDSSTTQRNVPVAVNAESGTSVLFGRKVRSMSFGSGSTHNMVIFGEPAASKIVVMGGRYDILHGSTTPSHYNLTHFGEVQIFYARRTNRFTISSVGNIPLHLTGTPLVTLSGPGADAFEVIKVPASTLPIGGSSSFDISFDPSMPGLHSATVTIQSDAVNHPSYNFVVTGFGALSTKRSQTITFAPPSTVFQDQSPLNLSAFSSSGLPVFLFVQGGGGTTAPGAAIVGNTLSFTGAGVVKVQALQLGDALYSAAPTVVKTITVKANPAPLTLLNLAQIYTGTAREISTLGGTGSVALEYKIGTNFGSTAPTDAGSYPVRATDSEVTKTGTLVISKAPLYVMPSNQRKFVGQDNPALSLSYTGWVNGQTDSLITTAPVLKTTATKTSLGGVYPITASGGVAPANYRFIYLQGALVVETFAGSYEALLRDSSDVLLGKLAITTAAANTSFSGKLFCKDEKAALSFTDSLQSSAETESATGSASVSSGGVPYVITVTISSTGSLSASVTRDDEPYASSSDGRRLLQLAKTQTVLYRGAHTAVLEPAVPTADAVPVGAGWATASISSKGVMTLAGRLGDGTDFTSALMPDDGTDPSYRLFVQPYKTGKSTRTQSHLSGLITLQPHPAATPALTGRRYAESAELTWVKTGLSTDTAYRTDFGPVSTVMMLDPWLAPLAAKGKVPAITLASRLGLPQNSFEVQHSDTGSTLNGNLPSRVGFSSKHLVSVITPAPSANSTKWKVKLDVSKGTFSGSFELADIPLKPRVATFSGVLRQPASAPDTLIGDGHYLLPPLSGTEKTTGEIMFLRP